MLPKPKSCEGCPAYGDGRGFVPDELVEGAPLLLMFQNPGDAEEEQGKPLVGRTGQMMERSFFPLINVQRGEVSLGNAFRCRWQHTNKMPPPDKLRPTLEHCTRAHHRVPSGTQAVLASGEVAAQAMTGLTADFSGWRGYALPYSPGRLKAQTFVWAPSSTEIPVLVTYHLAFMFRDPSAQVPLKADWKKLLRVARREWPRPFPRVDTVPPDAWPAVAAFDTEFTRETKTLVRYSLSTPERAVWVIEADDLTVLPVAPGSQVIMHNAVVDIPHLERVIPTASIRLDDTMYAHAVLWGGREPKDRDDPHGGVAFSHTLNYLGSLYGQTNRHKHLDRMNPVQYAAGDALHTMDSWLGMQKEFDRDQASRRVYEDFQRPLLPLILAHRAKGLRVNQERVKSSLQELKESQHGITLQAHATIGWPINLNSPAQVAHWLYDVERAA